MEQTLRRPPKVKSPLASTPSTDNDVENWTRVIQIMSGNPRFLAGVELPWRYQHRWQTESDIFLKNRWPSRYIEEDTNE